MHKLNLLSGPISLICVQISLRYPIDYVQNISFFETDFVWLQKNRMETANKARLMQNQARIAVGYTKLSKEASYLDRKTSVPVELYNCT